MSGAAAGSEHNPFDQFKKGFDTAADHLKLDGGIRDVLRMPNRELTVDMPVLMDDGRVKVFTGYRVQHNTRAARQGRHPLRARRQPRRGARALGVDDVEVRGRQRARSAAARAA